MWKSNQSTEVVINKFKMKSCVALGPDTCCSVRGAQALKAL